MIVLYLVQCLAVKSFIFPQKHESNHLQCLQTVTDRSLLLIQVSPGEDVVALCPPNEAVALAFHHLVYYSLVGVRDLHRQGQDVDLLEGDCLQMPKTTNN